MVPNDGVTDLPIGSSTTVIREGLGNVVILEPNDTVLLVGVGYDGVGNYNPAFGIPVVTITYLAGRIELTKLASNYWHLSGGYTVTSP
jgi:hypothetical protein